VSPVLTGRDSRGKRHSALSRCSRAGVSDHDRFAARNEQQNEDVIKLLREQNELLRQRVPVDGLSVAQPA